MFSLMVRYLTGAILTRGIILANTLFGNYTHTPTGETTTLIISVMAFRASILSIQSADTPDYQ